MKHTYSYFPVRVNKPWSSALPSYWLHIFLKLLSRAHVYLNPQRFRSDFRSQMLQDRGITYYLRVFCPTVLHQHPLTVLGIQKGLNYINARVSEKVTCGLVTSTIPFLFPFLLLLSYKHIKFSAGCQILNKICIISLFI